MSWGPLIAGHAHPDVVAAVTAAAARGTSFGAPTRGGGGARRGGRRARPGAEMVRMTSSGTEATMSALRLARAATGPRQDPQVRRRLPRPRGRAARRGGVGPRDAGHPVEPRRDRGAGGGHDHRSLERPRAAVEAASRWRRRDRLRALPGQHGPRRRPSRASSSSCASRPTRAGALLVFDEVISGFRVARGGAQEREAVTPDLTILGKVIGGGLPAAAYAGPARADGARRAGGRRLPGGHAVGKPARHRRRPGHAAPARRGRLRAARARPRRRSPRG